MANPVQVTSGDTQPLLTLTLYSDENATQLLDLTHAISVDWYFLPGTVVKSADIDPNPKTGKTTWKWDGDLSLVPGVYFVRALVKWDDGTEETSLGDCQIVVRPSAR